MLVWKEMWSIDLEREALKQSQSVLLNESKQQRKLLPASVQTLGPIIHLQGHLGLATDDGGKKESEVKKEKSN